VELFSEEAIGQVANEVGGLSEARKVGDQQVHDHLAEAMCYPTRKKTNEPFFVGAEARVEKRPLRQTKKKPINQKK